MADLQAVLSEAVKLNRSISQFWVYKDCAGTWAFGEHCKIVLQEGGAERCSRYGNAPTPKGTCLCCGVQVAQNPGRKEKKFCSDKCRKPFLFSCYSVSVFTIFATSRPP